MWTEVKSEIDLEQAMRWKKLFENEGVPARILPRSAVTKGAGAGFSVLVPREKEHIIKEVLRKL